MIAINKRRKLVGGASVALGLLLLAGAGPALGSPHFVIESEAEWLDAWSLGKVLPMAASEWSDYMNQWSLFLEEGDPYPPHDFNPPQLYVWGGGGGGGADPEDAGLVMAWGTAAGPTPDGVYSSAWRYDYQLDPDLSNSVITVTVTAPSASGINVVSFGIQDINGNIRAWYWNVGQPGDPIQHDTPTTITINTSMTGVGATTPTASSYMNNPAFDLTKSQWFIVDENANWVASAGIPPPGQVDPAPWNYWHNLMVLPFQGIIKWAQPPTFNPASPMPDCFWGWDEKSIYGGQQIVADDWLCEDDRPITNIHWWGSYLGWNDEQPPQIAPDTFHIGIWTDVPTNGTFSHPETMIHEWWVPRADLFERRVGCDYHPDVPAPGPDACFRYDFFIPEAEWFWQEPGPTVYWVSISAVYSGVVDPPFPWGWKTREHYFGDDAVRIFDPTDPVKFVDHYVNGEPILDAAGNTWDMAFVLTTDREPPPPSDVKWDQPPDPFQPDNVFYGWNEESTYWDLGPTVADDWVCTNSLPVTKIRWWGSYLGWKSASDPPQVPNHFHILVWTDVPAPTNGFSHPGQVIHEILCYNYTSQFVGWDYDPRTGEYEACFLFEQDLLPSEWFYQDPAGDRTIYWLSISACDNLQPPPANPWGWKTRPRDSTSPAPDDAVVITDPRMPVLGSAYVAGSPIEFPAGVSWDTAFELLSETPPPAPKWEQLPNPQWSGLHAHDWQDAAGAYHWNTLADDWLCQGGDVTDLHWWGNYELDVNGQEIRGAGIDHFHLSIHLCAGGVPWHLPQDPEDWGIDVPFAAAGETWTGMYNSEGCKIYLYEFDLPNPYFQIAGEYYWFDITAMSVDPGNFAIWRWQEANRSPLFLGHAPAAEKTEATNWQSIYWPPSDSYSDMAFRVTSGQPEPPRVKWSQPPKPYVPDDGYNGWNEASLYGGPQIVADDWVCTNSLPVTDIHWWGSYLGWGHPWPPQLPDAFHIGIWTDVPSNGAGAADFSHPGELIWEIYCDNFTWRFVGWDWDPRVPAGGTPNPPEACFRFDQYFAQDDWFYQDAGTNGIYWVSIAAVHTNGVPNYLWGWKTRPRDPNSPAPDDAVVIWDPTAPSIPAGINFYNAGAPIWYPTPEDSWDMAFRLTTLQCGPMDGDMDGDGDIDLADYAWFAACLGGPEVPYAAPDSVCECADFDKDDDVDLFDFGGFQLVFPYP